MIAELDEDAHRNIKVAFRSIAAQGSFFLGSFGREYSSEEMGGSFDQFIAEFAKQYCLDSEALRIYIRSLPPELQRAYGVFYDFFKDSIYGGREFTNDDLVFFQKSADRLREQAMGRKKT